MMSAADGQIDDQERIALRAFVAGGEGSRLAEIYDALGWDWQARRLASVRAGAAPTW